MAKLKVEERDELLIRLDERVENLSDHTLPSIENHLAKLNNRVAKHEGELAVHDIQFAKIDTKFKEHDGFFKAMPFNKRWFWALVVVLILSLAGTNVPEIMSLVG